MRRRALLLTAAAAAVAGLAGAPTLWQRFADGDTAWLDASGFNDLDGTPRALSEWRGRALAINFWATWCAPCREEIPLLMAARERHAARGLEVLGIAIDVAAPVRDYARRLGIRYPVLLSDAGGLGLMRRLGNPAGGLPFTAFADRRGRVVERKLGALSAAELEEILARLLA